MLRAVSLDFAVRRPIVSRGKIVEEFGLDLFNVETC